MPNNHHLLFKSSLPLAVKILFYEICKNSFNAARPRYRMLPAGETLAADRPGFEIRINA